MKPMKILFVLRQVDYIEPLGVLMLSAVARSLGHETECAVMAREDVLKKIAQGGFDLVAYSSTTGEHKYYISLNRRIKERFPSVFTIMGGSHPTFYPECLSGSTLDAICQGEGEEAFAELLGAIAQGKEISGIQNIISRKEGIDHGVRSLIKDLDTLPFADREVLYRNSSLGKFPLKSFMSSRGCPYECAYCFNHAYRRLYAGKGECVRRRSVDNLIEEILKVKAAYPLEFVKFYDDIFVYKPDSWFIDFVAAYKRKVGLPFHCLTRADLMTEEIAGLLKMAGCFSVSMSIESGSPRLRREVLRREMSNERMIQAFRFVEAQGLKTFANNIVGLPGSTFEDECLTLDLNLDCRVSFAEFPLYHPYPKTDLGERCIAQGLFKGGVEDLHPSYMNASPLDCFTPGEKNAQKNLSRLGPLVLLFPGLKSLVLKFLVRLPYNGLYFLAYYLSKAYMVRKRIYPFKMGLKSRLSLLKMSFGLEYMRLTKAPAVAGK